MSKLIEIKPEDRSRSVKDTLQSMLDRADNFDGVVVLALNKDSSQYMVTSNMSHIEKSFLCAFFNSFVSQWFSDVYHINKKEKINGTNSNNEP